LAVRATLTPEKVGTTDFMPPWAMGNLRIDDIRPSFDVFSLGKIIWCMISARPVLRLWYHHDSEHPEFDVERMFPNDPSMAWARRIFDKCIVQRERECLKDANQLLAEIDRTIEALTFGGQILGINRTIRCRFCGIGVYRTMFPPTMRAVNLI
jgi:serine/threonine protein kinase